MRCQLVITALHNLIPDLVVARLIDVNVLVSRHKFQIVRSASTVLDVDFRFVSRRNGVIMLAEVDGLEVSRESVSNLTRTLWCTLSYIDLSLCRRNSLCRLCHDP